MQPALKNIKLEKPKPKISHHVEKIKIVKTGRLKTLTPQRFCTTV